MLRIEENLGGQRTIPLRYFQGNRGTEIRMIRKFKLPFKITWLMMRKGKKKSLTLKFIVLETPPLFPI
jgi:hypothetical protein